MFDLIKEIYRGDNMFIFGVDVPLVEILIILGIINVIILIELIAALYMLLRHRRKQKILEIYNRKNK